MSIKILTNYDFNQNQLLNAVIQKLAVPPTNPVSGQMYYDTAKKRLFYFNGTKWEGSDALDAIMTGAGIVDAINSSTSTINDARLSQAVRDAIAKAHNTHAISDVTGLQTALDGKVDDSQVLTNVPASAKFTDTITTINGKTGAIAKADIVALGIPAQDTTYADATTTASGLMSATDKSKLNGVEAGANNYTHPSTHPASMITESTTKRFVSDTEKAVWNAKWDYNEATIKAVKVNSATNADTVNGKTVAENVPLNAKFTDTVTTVNGKTGAITKADITALGIPGQDTVYTHPTTDGNKHVPATGTTNNGKVLTAGATDGTMSWQTPSVKWTDVNDKPTSTSSAIDSAVSIAHSHSNKELLDTYNQTNANITDAVNKKHTQNSDIGTSSSTFYVGSGVKLKNNSGSLQVRNNADTAFSTIEGDNVKANGTLEVIGNATIGSGANTHIINSKTTTIKTSGKKSNVGAKDVNVFEIVDSDTVPNKLFEVKQNGDTVLAGVLTVNGEGTSVFAGNVDIGGALTVTKGTTANADFAGESLTLTGNLDVHGNTTLGDNAGVDTTTINGQTTVKSGKTKAVGSATVNAFAVKDSANAPLFEVRENGDTVIGGNLTVNGSSGSTFTGDVHIGGAITVANNATVNADYSGNNMTLTGNLEVKGNTIIGDDSSDTMVVKATTTLPTATTIGTVTYSDLTNAKSKAHSQNTDTGTNSATFQVGTNGVKIKNNSGTELQVRNADDTGYANLRLNNLYVEGTTTTINSNEVNIGDNEILLNSDITTNTLNSDGGIAVKRLMADNTTRKDAKLSFNNSIGKWETTGGAVTGALVTAQVANKITATIGDGVATSFSIAHNLNTRDVVVMIRESASPYEQVITDVEMTTVNTVKVSFASAPASNAYTITIIG